MARENLKVAVVGLGKMGLVHSCILNVLPNVQLAAVCEKRAITRRFSQGIFHGIRMVEDVEKLIGLDLDAVYVTTPIPSHFSVVKAICANKVASNLFVEKTLASNYEEAKELCELAHRSGGVNMVGYLRRFYVTFRRAKDLLSQDALGTVSYFKAYSFSSDFLESKLNPRAMASRGGALRDLGCHAVDLGLWFFGELQIASARLTSQVDGGSEDSVHFTIKNSNGLEGEFSVSWCVKNYRLPDVGFSVYGSKGTMNVNDDKVELKLKDGKSLTWYRHDLDDNVPFLLGLPEYYREDLHFCESTIEGLRADPSFCSAAKVDEIIDQVEKIAHRG